MSNKKNHANGILSLVLLAALLSGCGGGSSGSSGSPASPSPSPPVPPANLVGTWGGGTTDNPATLQVTSSGGTLSFACGVYDQLALPLTVDSTGHFTVAASELSSITTPRPVQLTGVVSGSTMTITQTYQGGGSSTYTLTYGRQPPTYNGGCPA
jgi:hypothetical protein